MSIDWAVFNENRNRFPPDQLVRYAGSWIAWSPDGTHVVASSTESEEALWQELDAKGLCSFDYVFSYIPPQDEVLLGPYSLRLDE